MIGAKWCLMLCSFEECDPQALVHSEHVYRQPNADFSHSFSSLYLSLSLYLYLSLPPRLLSLPLLSLHLFHAQHSQAMSWNKSIYKTRLGCGSYGRRGFFPGPDHSTFSLPRYRIIPFCHARRQSKLWRVSLYLWQPYFGQCDAATTINHLRKRPGEFLLLHYAKWSAFLTIAW